MKKMSHELLMFGNLKVKICTISHSIKKMHVVCNFGMENIFVFSKPRLTCVSFGRNGLYCLFYLLGYPMRADHMNF